MKGNDLQSHIKNPKKRDRILRNTRGRQRNRIREALQKLSSKMVEEHPNYSFIPEDLKSVRKRSKKTSRKNLTGSTRKQSKK